MYRKLGLDSAVVRRSNDAVARALAGGNQLTREQLRTVLERAGFEAAGEFRMGYLMMRAELDGVVCSGTRRGKQLTYALFEERVPPSRPLAREESLSELAHRYFCSRGPATVHDLAKWSGLTIAEARRGLEAARGTLQCDEMDGQSLWLPAPETPAERATTDVHLLSIYDEYISSYKDHTAQVTDEHAARLRALGNALTHVIIINGRIVGTWKPTLKKREVVIDTTVFRRLSSAELGALSKAACRYGEFHGLGADLSRVHQEKHG
jgi:hypothetical protein